MANAVIDGTGTSSDAGGRAGPGDPWKRRCELTALALVVGVLGLILQYLLEAVSLAQAGPGQDLEWSAFLPTFSYAGAIDRGVMLALALGLVVLAPGRGIGRMGRAVLNAVSILGVVVAALALLGLEETFRQDFGVGFGAGVGSNELLSQLSGVSFWIPSALLAGLVAYLAWKALLEVDPVLDWPDDTDEDRRGDGDGGSRGGADLSR